MKRLNFSTSVFLTLILLFSASPARAQVEDSYELAQKLYREGHYEQAIEQLQAAYQVKPRAKLLYNIGMAYLKLGQTAESSRYFQQFLKETRDLTPEQRAHIEKLIVRAPAQNSQPDTARNEPPQSDANPAGDPKASSGQDSRSAPTIPTQPIDSNNSPVEGEDRYDRAKAAYREGRYEEAIELLNVAYQFKHRSKLLFNIGMAYWKLQRYYEASAYFQRFLSAEPDMPPERRKEVESLITRARAVRSPEKGAARLGFDGLAAPSDPSFESSYAAGSRKPPLYKRWWVWALTATAVVGVTIAVAVPLALSRRSPCDKNSVDICAMPTSATASGLLIQGHF